MFSLMYNFFHLVRPIQCRCKSKGVRLINISLLKRSNKMFVLFLVLDTLDIFPSEIEKHKHKYSWRNETLTIYKIHLPYIKGFLRNDTCTLLRTISLHHIYYLPRRKWKSWQIDDDVWNEQIMSTALFTLNIINLI